MSSAAVVGVNLATVCIQSTLYGEFFVLAVTSLVLLTQRYNKENTFHHSHSAKSMFLLPWRSPLFVATFILLLNVTANWVVIVYRAFQAFVHFENGRNPVGFYDHVDSTAIALNALPTLAIIICDLMLIYRTWVVWNRKYWVAILPFFTTVALLVSSVIVVVIIAQKQSRTTDALDPWITAGYVFSLCNNLYGTSMIAYRIISASRGVRHIMSISGGRRILQMLSILVESAALYASWTLFVFVTYVTKATVNALANDCFAAVSGISLMLITVRVGLGWAHRGQPSSQNWSNQTGGTLIRDMLSRGEQTRDAIPLHTIMLNVSTSVERETDFAIPAPDPHKLCAPPAKGAEGLTG